jgi:hypothetical protein
MAVSDFLESFPKVSSSHRFSDSSNGLLRVSRTSRRSSGGCPRISFSMDYNTAMRLEPQLQREICVQPRDRKISSYVRPACRFLNASRFIDLIKASVTIRLQSAGKVAQVRLRMFVFAIR